MKKLFIKNTTKEVHIGDTLTLTMNYNVHDTLIREFEGSSIVHHFTSPVENVWYVTLTEDNVDCFIEEGYLEYREVNPIQDVEFNIEGMDDKSMEKCTKDIDEFMKSIGYVRVKDGLEGDKIDEDKSPKHFKIPMNVSFYEDRIAKDMMWRKGYKTLFFKNLKKINKGSYISLILKEIKNYTEENLYSEYTDRPVYYVSLVDLNVYTGSLKKFKGGYSIMFLDRENAELASKIVKSIS